MIKYDIKKINNKNIYFRPRLKMNISQELDKMITTVKARVEREIPDKGYFRSFAENFENKDSKLFGKYIAMSVERDELRDGEALLKLSVLHPNLPVDASNLLVAGNRKKILDYMNKENFKDEVENTVLKLSNSLKNTKF